jgi:hypothetical protein
MPIRKGRTIACCASLAGVAILGAALWIFKDAILEWPYRIPVVRTWGDLLAQAPIVLEDGPRVRLGIEATRCPQWSGVLLYCLAENYQPRELRTDDPLGPVGISVVEVGAQPATRDLMSWRQTGLIPPRGDSPQLFARTIGIPRAAKHRVEVRSPDGKLLRRVTVRGTRGDFHPWVPLSASRPAKQTRTTSGSGGGDAAAGAGTALPCWDGIEAYPDSESQEGSSNPSRLLPSLLPRSSEPEIRIQVRDARFLFVGSTEELLPADPLVPSNPNEHFLSRWWVNGRPCAASRSGLGRGGIAGPGTPAANAMAGTKTSTSTSAMLVLVLDFDAKRLGAQKGDTIGLQLLFVEQGWDYVDPESASLPPPLPAGRARTLLSDRIEFTAP